MNSVCIKTDAAVPRDKEHKRVFFLKYLSTTAATATSKINSTASKIY